MTKLIISAHSDDALFSISSFIYLMDNVIIVSPFDAIPEDEKGKKKHTILNDEHKQACKVIGAEIISGNFFDDVYEATRDLTGLQEWFKNVIASVGECEIFVPLGIHHPDHIIVRDIFIKHFRVDYFYAELPYRIRYPELFEELKKEFVSNRQLITCQSNNIKEQVVRKYVSQTDEQVIKDLLVQEMIWK